MRRPRSTRVPLLIALAAIATAGGADVPSPEAHLGFRPGADFHLATWDQVASYLRAVDDASDRVVVRDLGPTTEGRPYLVAIVTAPENLARLDFFQTMQHHLADPRRPTEPGIDPVAESRAVVLITGSIHSNETASTLMSLELLHGLATGDDPITREILDRTILLLVPSANPDGVDKVASWYARTLGKPWEGQGMPRLYHTYAGHDTNRDWFMLNLRETRLLTGLLYREWFPTLTYDVHQMGPRGARLFVPPFFDPINPNLHPLMHQSIAVVGSHMAADLAAEGKGGVLSHAMYDNWWNGGNRTTPQRHNMVGILTEAASVRLASPIFLEPDDLRGAARGFADHDPAVNFVDPWPGGWWHLRDIVEYELICARSLLTLAARYKDRFQANYRAMARDAIARGAIEPPSAWIVPIDQDDPGRASDLVGILRDSGIEVERALDSFQSGGLSFPAGSWVLPASQPYRPHLKDMLERQDYPDRFTGGGQAEPPYDVAGWTLSLQMGVRVVAASEPVTAATETVDRIEPMPGGIEGEDRPDHYLIDNRADDDFLVLNALLAGGIEVRAAPGGNATVGEREVPAGSLIVPTTDEARGVLEEALRHASSRAIGTRGPLRVGAGPGLIRLRPQRIGVYQPWVPSMDEGWTRFVLERYGFPFQTLHNADLRAGALRERIDVLLIPSIGPKTLGEGYGPDETEPAYVGGLGDEGAEALREFVRQGGTIVCLEDSCRYGIDVLGLDVVDRLDGLPSSRFYGPGSIVGVSYPRIGSASDSPILLGMPAEGSAYFDRSLAFDASKLGAISVVARYATTGVLQSGWLLGANQIAGQAALVEVPVERGRAVLFAFPPQHRGQTRGTFRLLFNALLRGGMEPAS